ncbi:hypothetical protein DPMN_068508 [Dreissena polymorpha]|uniref:Uncharacterized protein n=1 Tax=Dreissena polymorpha TaxID=45954 RepID=A0A9D3YXR9_DREPO|nr:hypothetical protein DPMN_068508 [Dreissena polymorpha]
MQSGAVLFVTDLSLSLDFESLVLKVVLRTATPTGGPLQGASNTTPTGVSRSVNTSSSRCNVDNKMGILYLLMD